MTSWNLYDKMTPSSTDSYVGQITEAGVNTNLSSFYNRLIKDAARCNNYQSDVVYNIMELMDALKTFRDDTNLDPIWIGFRRDGVDGTNFVLSRAENGKDSPERNIRREYFALYSVVVEHDPEIGWVNIRINEYWM